MKPSAVLRELLDRAVRDALTDLKAGDTNALLFVGEEGVAPTPRPTFEPTPEPAPTPAPLPGTFCPSDTSTGPDGDGDCKCKDHLYCFEDDSSGCTFSFTATGGYKSDRWFLPSCLGCKCL